MGDLMYSNQNWEWFDQYAGYQTEWLLVPQNIRYESLLLARVARISG